MIIKRRGKTRQEHLAIGTRVQTTQESKEVRDDWDEKYLEDRRWGVTGMIYGYNDSHGLCYVVQHEDGTTAWYAPSEFEVIK